MDEGNGKGVGVWEEDMWRGDWIWSKGMLGEKVKDGDGRCMKFEVNDMRNELIFSEGREMTEGLSGEMFNWVR